MRVRLTRDARSDLQNIKAFLAQRSAIVNARVIAQIAHVIERLQTLPRLGRPGIVQWTRERTVPRTPYVIVYRIDANDTEELVILRVYHAAQDRSHGDY